MLSFLLCLAGGGAVADASLGEMPPVAFEDSILRGMAGGHPLMPGTDIWVLFAFDYSAMWVGDAAPFADFAHHVITADTGDVVDHADWTDAVGLSYYPPYAVVILDGTLVDQPIENPENVSLRAISRLYQGGVEVARLMRGEPAGSSAWLSHVLFIDIASLDRAAVSECAARLVVATLYTSTIPDDFNFTRCAESLQ
ncbi:hypothetical protein Q4539_14560 [Yoonia sp. 1_MG-2023]|nr:hypothetical protein [Yoonia sp. 1_MG-2023]